MARANIEIHNENHVEKVSTIMAINGIDNSNKEKIINKALEIAYESINGLDEESLMSVCGLKKSV